MGRKRKDVTAAALTFVRASNPDDEIFVVNFNEHVSLGLPDTTLFSASTEELDRALNGIPASGKTALYDAIEAGMMHLKKATIGKKVLIVISDGGDNASHSKLEGALEVGQPAPISRFTLSAFLMRTTMIAIRKSLGRLPTPPAVKPSCLARRARSYRFVSGLRKTSAINTRLAMCRPIRIWTIPTERSR